MFNVFHQSIVHISIHYVPHIFIHPIHPFIPFCFSSTCTLKNPADMMDFIGVGEFDYEDKQHLSFQSRLVQCHVMIT